MFTKIAELQPGKAMSINIPTKKFLLREGNRLGCAFLASITFISLRSPSEKCILQFALDEASRSFRAIDFMLQCIINIAEHIVQWFQEEFVPRPETTLLVQTMVSCFFLSLQPPCYYLTSASTTPELLLPRRDQSCYLGAALNDVISL